MTPKNAWRIPIGVTFATTIKECLQTKQGNSVNKYIFLFLDSFDSFFASKCLVNAVLVVAIKTVCHNVLSSTTLDVLCSSVTPGFFKKSIREILVDFSFRHSFSKYPSSIVANPKLFDNTKIRI